MLKEAIIKLYGKIRYSRDLIHKVKDQQGDLEARVQALEKKTK